MKNLMDVVYARMQTVAVVLALTLLSCQSASVGDRERSRTMSGDSMSEIVMRGVDAVNFAALPRIRITGGGIFTDGKQLDSGRWVKVGNISEYKGILKWVTAAHEVGMLRAHIVQSAERLHEYQYAVGFGMMYIRSIYEKDELQIGCIFVGKNSCLAMVVGEGDSSVKEIRMSDTSCTIVHADLLDGFASYSNGWVEAMQGYFLIKAVLPHETTCVVVSYNDLFDLDPKVEWLKQFNDEQRRANRIAGAILSVFRAMKGRNRYPQ